MLFSYDQNARLINLTAESLDHAARFIDCTVNLILIKHYKEHIKKCSSCKNQPNNMKQFEIIRKCQTSYEAKIHEALVIKRSNPVLNKQMYANRRSFLLNVF